MHQELAKQLWRDVIPQLDPAGIKLFFVSIGPPKRGLEFCELTQFPADRMLADPENILYDAIGFCKGIMSTFFKVDTPFAIYQRILGGRINDLVNATRNWKAWIPPRRDQALQQGGALIFNGQDCVLAHYDEGTGAHIDLEVLVKAAMEA